MKSYASIKSLILAFVVTLMCVGCSNETDEITHDLTGSWKVVYYLNNGTKIIKTNDNTWPDMNNGDITAHFSEPDSNGKGTISGITVTNSYQGAYEILSKGKISIGPISTTFINQPEWTTLYHINKAQNFEIKNSRLFISYGNDENIIAFERN